MRRVPVLALAVAAALPGCRSEPPPALPEDKPDLALLTSLPIVFAESFSLDTPPSPLLKALEERYSVRAVDGPEQLRPMGRLLAIQPQALTAERLVAIDRWVREGGRLVLLADPRLEWESSRPLGDRFRPPFDYPDRGLLGRWGLRLGDAPEEQPAERRAEGSWQMTVAGAGELTATGRNCAVQEKLVAICSIGRGTVVVVADADMAMMGEPLNHEALITFIEAAS